MSDVKAMSMSELIMRHNELARQLGGPDVNEFKNLAAARAAVQTLEKKMTEATNTTAESSAASAASTDDKSKYASAGRRGPNQGVGAYAKELIAAGGDNKTVLEAVKAKFPDAKTTTACIAYYRTAVKNGGTVKRKGSPTPEELRAKAQALLDQAVASEKAAANAKAAADAKAAQTAETQPA